MPDNINDKNSSETARVEKTALDIIRADLKNAEEANRPTQGKRLSFEERRRESRRIYADRSVPRIRPERRFGGSSHSRAYLKESLSLYSDEAQQLFEENYERVNMNLIYSTLVIEAVGGTDLAERTVAAIEKEFSGLERRMIKALEALKKSAQEKGFDADELIAAYDHKRFYEPPMHTPLSSEFITVVSLYDRVVARADGCWLKHVIDTKIRNDMVEHFTRLIGKLIRTIDSIRSQANREARSRGFGKRASAIETQIRRESADDKLKISDVKTDAASAKADLAAQPAKAKSQTKVQAQTKTNQQAPAAPAAELKPEDKSQAAQAPAAPKPESPESEVPAQKPADSERESEKTPEPASSEQNSQEGGKETADQAAAPAAEPAPAASENQD